MARTYRYKRGRLGSDYFVEKTALNKLKQQVENLQSNPGGEVPSDLVEKVDSNTSRIEELEATINYKQITATVKSNITAMQEVGYTIPAVTVSWTTSKIPKSVKLNGTSLDVTTTSKTFNNVSSSTTYTLEVTDEKNTTKVSTAVSFGTAIYYGHLDVESGVTEAQIKALTKTLKTNKASTITPKSTTKKYIYVAVPASFGACKFTVGGFSGGFETPVVMNITNSHNKTISYNVYRSTNKLNDTTIVIS